MNIFSQNFKTKINKIDKCKIYESIISLDKQCLDAWNETGKIKLPPDYKKIDNIVMCGMGGSGLGARIIENLYKDIIPVPLIRVNDYDLPGFVGKRSLVICSSYSGTTEETLENARQAIKKGAKLIAIGTGKDLIGLARKQGIPFYKIDPKFNPSGQPRMGVGYNIISQIVLLSKLDLLRFSEENLQEIIKTIKNIDSKCDISLKPNNNPSMKMVNAIKGKIPVLVSAEHLIGATHVFNNQLNENSKSFSFDFFIPELNHHLMEGLRHPKSNNKNIIFILILSDLYNDKIKKRFAITQEVVQKNGVENLSYRLESKDKLTEVFELIQFGSYTNYYLSLAYNTDPSPIFWVDYFKKRLAEE